MNVKVLAREVQYGGRGRLRGEEFEADARWAKGKILTRQVEEVKIKAPVRRVSSTQPLPQTEPAGPEITEVIRPRRRAYSTRALTAED